MSIVHVLSHFRSICTYVWNTLLVTRIFHAFQSASSAFLVHVSRAKHSIVSLDNTAIVPSFRCRKSGDNVLFQSPSLYYVLFERVTGNRLVAKELQLKDYMAVRTSSAYESPDGIFFRRCLKFVEASRVIFLRNSRNRCLSRVIYTLENFTGTIQPTLCYVFAELLRGVAPRDGTLRLTWLVNFSFRVS